MRDDLARDDRPLSTDAHTGTIKAQSIGRSLVSVGFANAALPLTALIVSPILARSLGTTGRGIFANVIVPISFAPALLNLGQQEAAVYLMARRGFDRRAVRHAGTLVACLTGIFGLVLVWVLAAPLAHGDPRTSELIWAAAPYVPIMLLFQIVRANAIARCEFKYLNMERWSQTLVRLVGMSLLALFHALSVEAAIATHLGSVVLGSCVLLFLRRGAPHTYSVISTQLALRELTSFGTRLWVGSIGSMLLLRIDQILLGALSGPKELGLYAVAVSVAEVPMTVATALRLVLLPRLGVTPLAQLRRLAQHLVAGMLLVLPIMMLASWLLMPFVYGQQFTAARSMVLVLLLACLPLTLAELANIGLIAVGRPSAQLAGYAGGIAVTAFVLPIVAGPFGGLGASLTALFAYTVAAALAITCLHRGESESGLSWINPRLVGIAAVAGGMTCHKRMREWCS